MGTTVCQTGVQGVRVGHLRRRARPAQMVYGTVRRVPTPDEEFVENVLPESVVSRSPHTSMRLPTVFPYVLWILALSLLGPLAGCAQKSDVEPHAKETVPFDSIGTKDVPYVATPQRVVERMLELGDVTADDVVYDLGSGDGRFLITAAQQYGARGVGFEIDPQLVEQARANARLAGVTDRVEFRQQDLFEADLRDASVVMLYLEPELNLRLRPRLLLQLNPGDRVVSHDFDMGAWTPDRVEQMEGSTLYRWTIPRQIPDSLGSQETSP